MPPGAGRPGALAPGGLVEAPNAYLASPTAILVEVGVPVFDGGDAVVNFEVQGHAPTSPAAPAEPGCAVVPAADCCADHVTQFDADDGVFTFTEKNDTGARSRRARTVTFPDDGIGNFHGAGDLYATAIRRVLPTFVEPGHARAASSPWPPTATTSSRASCASSARATASRA